MIAEGEHRVALKKKDKVILEQVVTVTGKKKITISMRGAADDAKSEFNRGVALYKEGLYSDAAKAFRRANAM